MQIDFISILTEASRFQPVLQDMTSKTLSIILGIVSNNNDPENRRRVKVTSSSSPELESHWYPRLSEKGNDEPVPKIGDTVAVLSIEGNDILSFYHPVQNDTNPALDKTDVLLDRYSYTEGAVQHSTDKTYTVKAKDDIEVTSEKESLYSSVEKTTVQATPAFKILIDPVTGSITLQAPTIFISGNVVQIPYPGSGTPSSSFNGSLDITSANSVSINGKQILTLGSIDDEGDISVSRGWS